jgi:glutathione S-transferase
MLHWKDIGRADRAGRYISRRLTRVYPSYWLVLLPIIPFDYFFHTLFDDYNQPLEVLKSVFLLPQAHTILDVTWSMRNELLFYSLFALLILNRSVGSAVVALWLAATVARPFLGDLTGDVWVNLLTYPMNFEFLCGVAGGWAFRRIVIRRPLLLLGVGASLFLTLWVMEDFRLFAEINRNDWLFIGRSLLYGTASVLAITGLSAMELAGRLTLPRPMIVLGGASYLIYLVHVPALLVLGSTERRLHLLRFAPPWALAGLFIALTLAGAVMLHLWVEKPMLGGIRRLTARKPAPPRPSDAHNEDCVMKLYFAPGACSLSPHIALFESGLPFEAEAVNLRTKITAGGADYRQINPKGAVPALVLDTGEVLTEGAAIVQYIADQAPLSAIAPPAGTLERYRLQEWLNYVASELHKGFSPLLRPNTPDDYKPLVIAQLRGKLDYLQGWLEGHEYLLGSAFSVADGYLFTILGWTPIAGLDLADWPAVKAYVERVGARPAVKSAQAAEGRR